LLLFHNHRALQPTKEQRQPRRRLSPKMLKLLRQGDSARRYPSRSEVVMAITTDVVNARLPETYLLKILMNPENAAGEKVREIAKRDGQKAAEKYVSRTYAKARELVRQRPAFRDSADARAAIAALEQALKRVSWNGKAGGTDRAVIDTFIQIAERVGSLTFQASIRQIAEQSGVSSLGTVLHSIGRLREWVARIKKGGSGEASTWQLNAPPVDVNENNNISRGSERYCSYKGHSAGEDIWRWKGLGKLAWLTWRVLWSANGMPRSASLSEIATELHISPNAARRRLARLQRFGLAEKGEKGHWRPVKRDFSEMAEQFGVAGSLDRQRARHEEHRLAYRLHFGRPMRLPCTARPLRLRLDQKSSGNHESGGL
jgi:hypothetical protein